METDAKQCSPYYQSDMTACQRAALVFAEEAFSRAGPDAKLLVSGAGVLKMQPTSSDCAMDSLHPGTKVPFLG